jgi:membrane protease YdiL (CAAX protease family)
MGLIPIPFGYCIPVLLVVWGALKINRESMTGVAFNGNRFSWKAMLLGCVTGILLFVFLQYLFFPLLSKLVNLKKADLSDFDNIRHHWGMYLFVLLMGWLVGGLYEEFVFHAFIFTRLEKMLAGPHSWIISFIITNILFGLYHFQLGISGMINALLAGCVYHIIMLRNNRNIWYAFFCHGVFDTIGLTLIYKGYW